LGTHCFREPDSRVTTCVDLDRPAPEPVRLGELASRVGDSNHALNERLNGLGDGYGFVTNNAVGGIAGISSELGGRAGALPRSASYRPTTVGYTSSGRPTTQLPTVPQAIRPAGVPAPAPTPSPAPRGRPGTQVVTSGAASEVISGELATLSHLERNPLHPAHFFNNPGVSTTLGVLGVLQGVDQARTGLRQLRGQEADPYVERHLNVAAGTTGALSGAVGTVNGVLALGGAALPGVVTGAGAVAGSAAGGIALGMRGNQFVRDRRLLGDRAGVTTERGVTGGGPDGRVARDWSDVAVDQGLALRRELLDRGTSERRADLAGRVATGLYCLPAAAGAAVTGLAGLGTDLHRAVTTMPSSDLSDIEARDAEERDPGGRSVAPPDATEAERARVARVQAHRERLREERGERQRRQAAAVQQAETERRAATDRATGTVRHAAGAPVSEYQVQQRSRAIQQRWALERGEVGVSLDLDELERADAQARRELGAESAGGRADDVRVLTRPAPAAPRPAPAAPRPAVGEPPPMLARNPPAEPWWAAPLELPRPGDGVRRPAS
jgi:hypothetical protein